MMIGKNENLANENTECLDSFVEREKSLEETSAKVKEEVVLCFQQLARVLKEREKQLLHKIETIYNQQLNIVHSNLENSQLVNFPRIDLSKKTAIEASILRFGDLATSERRSVSANNAESCKIEDCIVAKEEDVILGKSIANDQEKDPERERLHESLEKSFESSCDVSFEHDITKENEITVIMREPPCSNGLPEDSQITPKDLSPDWKDVGRSIRKSLFDAEEDDTSPEMQISLEELNENRKSPDFETTTKEFESPLENPSTNNESSTVIIKSQEAEHPKQIQQWLQQILVETETEPTIHEIEQFDDITKSRFKQMRFPVET